MLELGCLCLGGGLPNGEKEKKRKEKKKKKETDKKQKHVPLKRDLGISI